MKCGYCKQEYKHEEQAIECCEEMKRKYPKIIPAIKSKGGD